MMKMKGSAAVGVSVGVLLSAILSTLLPALTAVLILSGHAEIEKIQFFTIPIQYISVMLGSVVATKLAAKAPGLICSIVTALYVFLLIAVNVMFLEGSLSAVWSAIIASVLGWATACLLCIKKSDKKKYRMVRNR